MTDTPGIAVHGAGWVAGEYIKAFARNPHCRVRVVNSRREASARARLAEAGVEADVATDYEGVLRRPDVDVVAVCTPSDRHPDDTVAAAAAGKHLVIEKPVALDLPNLRRMRAAVRRAGVRSVVGFVLRWNPLLATVKALIDDGVLGRIFLAETGYFHDIGPWYRGYAWATTRAAGGSTMLFSGCHAVDALRWLAGEVTEVSAYETRGHNRDYEYAPSVVASLKLAGGGVGVVAASFEVPMPYTFPVQLHGTEGAFRDGRLYSTARFPGPTDGIRIPSVGPDSGDVTHHPFQGEVDRFVACVRDGRESHCNLDDAVKTHEVCLAIDRSAAGGQPVRLPL